MAGLGAVTLAGCSRVPEPSASPTGAVDAQLEAAIEVIKGQNALFGVALKDLRGGTVWGLAPDYASQSASMAKPMIVAMALRKARLDGTTLSDEQLEDCRKAITISDNDAADRLWAFAGTSAAYDELAAALGLAATHSDPARDFWSWTWTTPTDQLKLLETLLGPGADAITSAEAAFILDLMGNVADDQAWGVGTVRSDSVAVELKNGWVQFESTDNLWAVNSIGHVTGGDCEYLLAVMNRTPDFETGRDTCTAVGKWVYEILT